MNRKHLKQLRHSSVHRTNVMHQILISHVPAMDIFYRYVYNYYIQNLYDNNNFYAQKHSNHNSFNSKPACFFHSLSQLLQHLAI